MALWRFLDYHSAAGNNLIEEWYLDQPEEAKPSSMSHSRLCRSRKIGEDCLIRLFRARWIMRNPIQGRKNPVSSSRILRTWGEVLFDLCRLQQEGQNLHSANAFDLAMKRKGKVARGEAFLHERFV